MKKIWGVRTCESSDGQSNAWDFTGGHLWWFEVVEMKFGWEGVWELFWLVVGSTGVGPSWLLQVRETYVG